MKRTSNGAIGTIDSGEENISELEEIVVEIIKKWKIMRIENNN